MKINVEEHDMVAYSPPHQQAIEREPIPVEVFSSHLEIMHLNENCGFIEEYKVVQLLVYLTIFNIINSGPPLDTCTPPSLTRDHSAYKTSFKEY